MPADQIDRYFADLLEAAPSSNRAEALDFARCTLIRSVERALLRLISEGRLQGTTHTCIGQEAVAVGVCAALRKGDIVVSNHRCHGHFLAHTGEIAGFLAEMLGQEGAVCDGMGGSQHLCVEGAFYSNGVLGGPAAMALGIALAAQHDNNGDAVAVFLGDGALGEGLVYEAFNIASKWRLPILFVVEDNGIAQSTDSATTIAGDIGARAAAFGIDWTCLDNPVAEEIRSEAARARGDVVSEGPRLLWVKCPRLGPHSKGDDTRSAEELTVLAEADPLARMRHSLSAPLADAIEQRADETTSALLAEVLDRPLLPQPDRRADGRSAEWSDNGAQPAAFNGTTHRESLNAALRSALSRWEDLFVIGEDICGDYGGAFKITRGLDKDFPARVRSTPISEAAIVGIAGGLMLRRKNCIVEIMFGDFLSLAMDQLLNHIAKFRGMYALSDTGTVLVRTPMGGRRGYGPTHSQSTEKHFCGISGLRVVAPTHLHPIDTMMGALLADGIPCLWIEHKSLYDLAPNQTAPGKIDNFIVEFGADERAPSITLQLLGGTVDATIVTYGGNLPIAMQAAKSLMINEEIAVKIVALAALNFLSDAELVRLLGDGTPLLTLEESTCGFGFGAEIVARLAELNILARRPVARIGALEGVIPAAPHLEAETLFTAELVERRVLELVQEGSESWQ